MKLIYRFPAIGMCILAAVLGTGPVWAQGKGTSVVAQSVAAIPPGGFSGAVKQAVPAVVNISCVRVVRVTDPKAPVSGPLGLLPHTRRERDSGSGVVVTPDGYILTNNHVIEGATKVTVSLSDKREFNATIVGSDDKSDVAVLKIEAGNLPVLPLGDSSTAQVGDIALAIGNPFGLGQTVTMGIVSALGRGNLGIERYEDFIQTDAAINPGNSGGALINTKGELIGINTAILANENGGNQGVGFAIPSNMARNIMSEIRDHGEVIRGWVGIEIQDLSGGLAAAFGVPDNNGVLVTDIESDGPAYSAGLQRGDVIRQIDGRAIEDGRMLSMKIAEASPGRTLEFLVLRDGSERRLPAVVEKMPSDKQAEENPEPQSSRKLGLAIQDVNAQIARDLGIEPGTTGVLVVAVQPESPAFDSGLQPGDIVQEVNRKSIKTANEFRNAVSNPTDVILLSVNRGGHNLYMVVDRRV